MKTKTQLFFELWIESRTRFTNQIATITEQYLLKKLGTYPISVGFFDVSYWRCRIAFC
jgi:hypothetical protein